MQQVTRSDPAPSRLAYRVQRLLLTPLFRLVLRIGVPLFATFGAATLWLSDQDNRDAFVGAYFNAREAFVTRPEFMVNVMSIYGASEIVSEDIREILLLDLPLSSFDLDLDAMRGAVAGLDAVKSARVRVKAGGILQIDVEERTPAVIWRSRAGLELIDADGVLVAPADTREDWPILPVIAGDGASGAVDEALALLASAGPLAHRMRGLERIGERRWDVVLDRGQRILLPVDAPVQALERVIALDQAMDMLNRDLVAVDLRLPDRPTLRITEPAVQEFWRIKQLQTGDNAGQ